MDLDVYADDTILQLLEGTEEIVYADNLKYTRGSREALEEGFRLFNGVN
jgi:hypothetical protein